MKRASGKSSCPINFALEVYGDPWSLLIVRDIVFWGKKTYGEFLDSEEGVATNVLASRLAKLEAMGILTKIPHESDKRKLQYSLTDKGLDLIPIVLEMAYWSVKHGDNVNAPKHIVDVVRADRGNLYTTVQRRIKEGGTI